MFTSIKMEYLKDSAPSRIDYLYGSLKATNRKSLILKVENLLAKDPDLTGANLKLAAIGKKKKPKKI